MSVFLIFFKTLTFDMSRIFIKPTLSKSTQTKVLKSMWWRHRSYEVSLNVLASISLGTLYNAIFEFLFLISYFDNQSLCRYILQRLEVDFLPLLILW